MEFKKDDSCRVQKSSFKCSLTHVFFNVLDIGSRLFANEVGADLFISLHQNAYVEDHSVNGIEVYYNNREKSVESEKITQLIQAGLITETGAKDRGIRAYNELVVTRETTMPSCLVEMGYMSNPTELSLMNSDSYQDKTVTGIVNGINQFFE